MAICAFDFEAHEAVIDRQVCINNLVKKKHNEIKNGVQFFKLIYVRSIFYYSMQKK